MPELKVITSPPEKPVWVGLAMVIVPWLRSMLAPVKRMRLLALMVMSPLLMMVSASTRSLEVPREETKPLLVVTRDKPPKSITPLLPLPALL